MVQKIKWTEKARDDLRGLRDFIGNNSEFYAWTVVKKIVDATRTLLDFPLSGRIVPEFSDKTIRELLVYK